MYGVELSRNMEHGMPSRLRPERASNGLTPTQASVYQGALGGTPNGDPSSLLGVTWVLPGYIGVYKAYIRVI